MSTEDTVTPGEELTDVERMIQDAIRIEDATVPTEERVDAVEASISDVERKARWLQRRPNIDHLRSGVVTTTIEGVQTVLPLFDVGDRIVVDVSTTFLKGDPWLYTLVGKVRAIDDDSGVVQVWDEDTDGRNPMLRHVNVKDPLMVFKLAPTRGNPFDATYAVRTPKPALKPGEMRRGRGRPKGSHNRPKEVIKAEREALKALRAEKRARR